MVGKLLRSNKKPECITALDHDGRPTHIDEGARQLLATQFPWSAAFSKTASSLHPLLRINILQTSHQGLRLGVHLGPLFLHFSWPGGRQQEGIFQFLPSLPRSPPPISLGAQRPGLAPVLDSRPFPSPERRTQTCVAQAPQVRNSAPHSPDDLESQKLAEAGAKVTALSGANC